MAQTIGQPAGKRSLLSRHSLVRALPTFVLAALSVVLIQFISYQIATLVAERDIEQGLALNQQQEYDAAIGAFTEAIQARHDLVDAYLYRGTALLEAGRAQKSVADFSDALTLEPGRTILYVYRGDSYQAMGRRDLAEADYEYALATAGTDTRLIATARTKLYLLGRDAP